MAVIVELLWFMSRPLSPETNIPLAFVLDPATLEHFCLELHVLSEIEGIADLVEIFPDIGGVGEVSRPVGVL